MNGALSMALFNWPQYVQGSLAVATAILAARTARLPRSLRLSALAGAAAGGGWLVGSVAVAHWIYDRSPIADWSVLGGELSEPPQRWANVHAGYDGTTAAIRRIFPGTTGVAMDLYDPAIITEPSVRRARAFYPPGPGTLPARIDSLPAADASMDAVFLLFAAHELRRRADRQRLHTEVRRILRPDGSLVLVEHDRDVANFVAFGPGVMHFLPLAEWHRAADRAGLRLISAQRITPFVEVMTWCRR